jgi:hypothetical protein
VEIDRDKLIGKTEHKITQREKDAWNAGKKDAASSKKLQDREKSSVDQAIAIVKLYAQHGDVHYVGVRLDVRASEIRRVLKSYNIHSIENAREVVRKGIIAEYDEAANANRDQAEMERRADHAVRAERFDKRQRDKEVKKKTPGEKDALLAKRREAADVLNKQDRLRQLMAEGLDSNASKFRIPFYDVPKFKALIPHGVGQLQRQFGGTAKEIVSEVRRLAPNIDTDMLRR